MTAEGQEEGKGKMTLEEVRAENTRLEEELRKALEAVAREKSERNREAEQHRLALAALKSKVGELATIQTGTSEKPMVEIELPGLMRLVMSGSVAAHFCGTKEGRTNGTKQN